MSDESAKHPSRPNAVAVIGMACRFPGGRNVHEFWCNLRDGVESTKPLSEDVLRAAGVTPAQLADPAYVKSAAVLDGMEEFDAGFFGFSPKEASIMDPQHRHFLECGWEAFEDAGYDPLTYSGSIGAFAGCGMQAYFTQNLAPNRQLMDGTGLFLVRHTGNDKDFLTTRLSYQFNLRGPSISIQTACSTSLVAIHAAAQSILSGECDLAIAGGVTIELPHRQGYLYQEGEILSHDGHCRSFDAASTGTVFGSGVGAVILKRYDDAVADGDTIHALILGSAVNNDGAGKVSYLAPSVDGQAAAVSEALAVAGIDAGTVTYVETHGTGTQIGDPIEVTALTQAFRESSNGRGFCALGAVKTNIGHLDTAAGVAGFIKTVLALKHRLIPPTLHFQRPNPQIPFDRSPFFVNARLREWTLPPGVDVRRAGINALGVGGTNAHVILEEAPIVAPAPVAHPAHLLAWSGRNEQVLDKMIARFAAHLREHPQLDLAAAEFTLRAGRHAFKNRRVIAVRDVADALATLEARDAKRLFTGRAADPAPTLVYMFPGGGVQYPNMGLQLHEDNPVYRRALDESLELLQRRWQIDLRSLLFPAAGKEAWAAEQLERPLYSILSIFVTERAMAELWISLGLKPAMMTGHSLGEYTAACIAGVISLADTLAIVVARGRIFERLPAGAMLSVRLDEPELAPHLSPGHSLAAVNAPSLCVVSGTVEDVEDLAARLDALDIENQRLRINVAAHSRMLDPFLDEFRAAFADIRFQPPKIPFISNLTGRVAEASEVGTAEYWVRHLRQTVRFSAGLRALQQAHPNGLLVEIGPGNALSSLASLHELTAIPSMRHPKEIGPDHQFLLSALGRIWSFGYPIDWDKVQPAAPARRIPLPTYPFEHQRYWIEAGRSTGTMVAAEPDRLERRPKIEGWLSRPAWLELPAGSARAGLSPDRILLVGGADPLASELGASLQERLGGSGRIPTLIRVVPGARYERLDPHTFHITAGTEGDFERVLAESAGAAGGNPLVVFLGAAGAPVDPSGKPGTEPAGESFNQVISLARALGTIADAMPPRLVAVTTDSFSVAGECAVNPSPHLVIGALRVVPREYPSVRTQVIDVASSSLAGRQRPETLAALAAEISAEPEHREIVLRAGRRWTPALAPVPLPDPATARSLLKRGGVYMITGGLGGLGLELAHHLASTQGAKLVLVSRSSANNGAVHAAQDKLRQFESLGDVMVAQGEVTNFASLESVVQSAEARFGQIDGVFHCAGMVDDGLIAIKSREAMERVLRPKVAGTAAIIEVFRKRPLDFVVFYSSTSSWLGLPGQVDYAAGNAYLDAVAASADRALPWPVRTIGWGAWRDVGIAARLVAGAGTNHRATAGTPALHPFLGTHQPVPEGKRRFSALWDAAGLWALDGHRNREGIALFPGTGYLELARAALGPAQDGAFVSIQDLVFIAPLVVEGPTEVQIEIEPEGDFVVTSRPIDGTAAGAWSEHARGVARLVPGALPGQMDINSLRARCGLAHRVYHPGEPATRQDTMLRFGKRWANIRQAWFGDGIALAEMSLPGEFAPDLAETPFHPAVVDIATAFALPLVRGYAEANWFYVPLSYRHVEIFRSLPTTCFSVARCADAGQSDTVVMDVTLVAASGEVLARISGFTMKRLAEPQLKVHQPRDFSDGRPAGGGKPGIPPFEELVLGGISPAEGMRVIDAVLTGAAPAHVFASPFDPATWSRLLTTTADTNASRTDAHESAGGAAVSQPRPKISSTYVPPVSETDRKLAGIWKEALGLAEVGLDDNYFELGGNSLGLVQLIMKCRKAIKAAIPVGDPTLLANPTIRVMAAFAAAKDAPAEPADGGPKRVSRDKFKVGRVAVR